MTTEAKAPIIIKRKKVTAGGGHHGGAWKVAYADFVTAMMAFFMLMWLLNATTEQQRKGLADYFAPAIAVSRVSGGGEGMYGGDSLQSEDTLIRTGSGASQTFSTESNASRGSTGHDADGGADRDPEMDALEEALRARAGESLDDGVMRHVTLKVTDEGLAVEVFALPGRPLFEPAPDGGERPTATMRAIAASLAGGFATVRNDVAVAGHVAARPLPLRADPAWATSHARADSVRRLLEEAGLGRGRAARVTGHADRDPAVADAMDVRNDRIEVILLRE
jgi:chemotaxis protein MotB